MDKVTQQSAANAEEVAASVEELRGQASALQNAVLDIGRVVQGDGADMPASGAGRQEAVARPKARRPALSAPSGRVRHVPPRPAGRDDVAGKAAASRQAAEDIFPLGDDGDSMKDF
jgi:hypothetical protein